MKYLYTLTLAVFTTATLSAQSLAVTEMDTVLEVNSTAVADYGFSIKVQNVSSESVDVYVKRAYSNADCAFDSAYFCWDYCYGADVDNSIGYVTFNASDIRSDFSGHVYSPNSGMACSDSTRYVFYNGKDPSDSLSVWVTIAAGPTVGTVELVVEEGKLYPNPAQNYVTIETVQEGVFVLYNALGERVIIEELYAGQNAIPVSDLSNGVYLYSIDGSSFKRLVINH